MDSKETTIAYRIVYIFGLLLMAGLVIITMALYVDFILWLFQIV